MGLLDGLLGKKPSKKTITVVQKPQKRARATKKQVTERRIKEIEAESRLLDAELELARKRDELSTRREGKKIDEEDVDPLAVAEQTVARVDRFQRRIGGRTGGEGESKLATIVNSQLACTLAQVAGPDLLRAFVAAVTGQKVPAAEPQAIVTITNPQAVDVGVTAAPAVTEAQAEAVPPEEPQSAPLLVQWGISQLERKNPAEAAAWLVSLSQKREDARQLVALVTGLKDEQIPSALAQAEQDYPNVAPLIQWLRGRPEWLLATIHELRRLAAEEQPEHRPSMGL